MTDTERGQPYPFLSKVAEIRRRARQHIANGAVTVNYAADRDVVLRLLNEALAGGGVCPALPAALLHGERDGG